MEGSSDHEELLSISGTAPRSCATRGARLRGAAALAVGLVCAPAVLWAVRGKADGLASPQLRNAVLLDDVGSTLAPTTAEALPKTMTSQFGHTCPSAAVSDAPPPGAAQPSKGCGTLARHRLCTPDAAQSSKGRGRQGPGIQTRNISVPDPLLGKNVLRHYAISMPEAACNALPGSPAPLSLWFHGQYGTATGEAEGWATASGLRTCTFANDFITVFPMGTSFQEDGKVAGDVSSEVKAGNIDSTDMGTGWNVGTGGDDETCVTSDDTKGGLSKVNATVYSCYPTCIKKNQCGKCNWSTCTDDVGFVKALISAIADEFCIDLSRIYAGGQSNGGMLLHYLTQELPGTFAAVNPIYALPLLNYDFGSGGEFMRSLDLLRETAIIEFHARDDTIIPYHGGMATYAEAPWYYESLNHVMSIWSGVHGCKKDKTDITNDILKACPQTDSNVRCYEHNDCSTTKRVIFCLYDGYHGKVPKNDVFGCMSVWFFNQFRRSTLVQLSSPKHI